MWLFYGMLKWIFVILEISNMQAFFLFEGDLKVEVGFHLSLKKKRKKLSFPALWKLGMGIRHNLRQHKSQLNFWTLRKEHKKLQRKLRSQVMYGCESWTVKKAEHRRIDAFELWCWRRLLRVPWTARRFNQSILEEISPRISLEGMMLKLKLQYFGHLMRRVDSLEKTDAGRDWGQEEKGTTEDEMAGWHQWLDGCESEWTPGVGDGQGGLVWCDSWGCKELDTTERLIWSEDTGKENLQYMRRIVHHDQLA